MWRMSLLSYQTWSNCHEDTSFLATVLELIVQSLVFWFIKVGRRSPLSLIDFTRQNANFNPNNYSFTECLLRRNLSHIDCWFLVLWSKAIATASLLMEYKVHSFTCSALSLPDEENGSFPACFFCCDLLLYCFEILEVWKHLANDHSKL